MSEFKLGDKLRITKAPVGVGPKVGDILTVVQETNCDSWITRTCIELGYIEWSMTEGLWDYSLGVPIEEVLAEQPVRNKYMREIAPGVWVDVYDVLYAFGVTDPCLQHLIKKALATGVRGHKSTREDLVDIRDSAIRAVEHYDKMNPVDKTTE